MTTKKSNWMSVLAVVATVVLYGILFTSAKKNTAEEWMESFPIIGESTVLETQRSVKEQFTDTRTWLLDNCSNTARNLSGIAESNMITVPFSILYKQGLTGTGILEFNLVVEFKEGRMRWSTRDVVLVWESGKYRYTCTHTSGYGGDKFKGGYRSFREEGSKEYQKWLAFIGEGMNKVAQGNLAESDW